MTRGICADYAQLSSNKPNIHAWNIYTGKKIIGDLKSNVLRTISLNLSLRGVTSMLKTLTSPRVLTSDHMVEMSRF
jgi:hypothetical protein